MNDLHLACAARGTYIEHSAAMIHSVLVKATGRPVRVHFLCDAEMDGEHADALTAMVEQMGGSIGFIEIDAAQVEGLPVQAQFTAAMWYRILLPELLPEIDRVLYLDVDTLALDDLGPLWETDLGDDYLAAVSNVFQHNHIHRPEELGLPPSQAYFNSGVLLLNLEAMRLGDCASELRDFAVANADRLEWPDQDALNVVLGHRRVSLHPRWNCMNSVLNFPASIDVFGAEAVELARAKPAIRHFEGPGANKPWHYLSDTPHRDRYFEHRAQTPWPVCAIEGATPRNVVGRVARDLRHGPRAAIRAARDGVRASR